MTPEMWFDIEPIPHQQQQQQQQQQPQQKQQQQQRQLQQHPDNNNNNNNHLEHKALFSTEKGSHSRPADTTTLRVGRLVLHQP